MIRGEITIGELIAAIQLLNSVFQPINTLSQKLAVLRSTTDIQQKIALEIGGMKPELKTEPASETPASPALSEQEPAAQGASVIFDQVTFGFKYAASEQIRTLFQNLSFEMEPGKIYAITGESGRGKSTLAKLLLNYYTGYEGTLLLNMRNLSISTSSACKASQESSLPTIGTRHIWSGLTECCILETVKRREQLSCGTKGSWPKKA